LTDRRKWVTARLIAAPESLRATVQEAASMAVQRTTGSVRGDFADELMAAAERRLGSPGVSHATALDLLTADTLITLACEWVAENDPGRLGELR
jgi:hypothetical protein